MAGTITIDIEAKLVDNAMSGLEALDKKIDELNSKTVTIRSEFDSSAGEGIGAATRIYNKAQERLERATRNYSDIGTHDPIASVPSYTDIGRDMGRGFAQEASKVTEPATEAVTNDRAYLSNLVDKAADRIYNGSDQTQPIRQTSQRVSEERAYLDDVINRAVDTAYSEGTGTGSRYAVPDDEASAYINPLDPGTATDRIYGAESVNGFPQSALSAMAETAAPVVAEVAEETHPVADAMQQTAAQISRAAAEMTDVQATNQRADAQSLTRAIMSATGTSKYATMGSQMARYLGLDSTSWRGIATGLATAVGIAKTADGLTTGLSRIVGSFNEENSVDAARSRATGISQMALTGIGAAIGSILPGIGTLIGASIGGGLGSVAGDFFGEDLGSFFSGYDKTYAEYQADGLKKYFGNFVMSGSQTDALTKSILGKSLVVKESNGFLGGLESTLNTRQELQAMSDEVKIRGSKFQIFDNLELKNSEDDLKEYGEYIKTFGETAEDYLSTSMFKDLAAADTIFGEGNPYVQPIADQYSGKIAGIKSIADELDDYLEKFEDGGSPDATVLTTYQRRLQELIGETSSDELQNQLDVADLMRGSGAISKDSFDSVMDSLNESYNTAMVDRANELVSLVRNGSISQAAAEDSFNEYALAQGGQMMSRKYDMAKSQVDNYDEGMISVAEKFNDFYSGLDDAMNERGLWGYKQYVSGNGGYFGGSESDRRHAFGFVDDETTDIFKSDYEKYGVSDYENYIKKANDIGNYAGDEGIYGLLHGYELGARGGVEGATDKYLGARMAMDSRLSGMMEYFREMPDMWESLPEAMRDTYDMFRTNMGFNGQKQPEQTPSEETKPASQETQPPSETTQPQSEETQPASETTAPSAEETQPQENQEAAAETTAPPETTEAPAADLGKSVIDAINQGLSGDIEGLDGVGQNLMGKIAESMSAENLSGMDTSIGESLMNSISGSLAEVDLSSMDMNFGESLMSKVAESMSAENLAGMDTSIGESLMSSINSSLAEIDLSGADINIGESLMAKISESLSSIAGAGFEGIDLSGMGSALSAGIASSLQSVELGDIGTGIQEQITASLSETTIDATITVNPTYQLSETGTGLQEQISASWGELSVDATIMVNATYQLLDAGAGLQEQLSAVTASIDTSVTATVTYTLDSSAVDSYTPPPKTAVATYTVDSSQVDGWQPPNKTATVTYNVVVNGSLPNPGNLHFVEGTNYMPYNSLATINDEATADPRELVLHDGRGYLFEGRNVRVPLSTGDRVFTASQTKSMLGGSYAEGYDNYANFGEQENENYKAFAGDSEESSDGSGGKSGSVSFGGSRVTIGNMNFVIESKGDGRDIVEEIKDRADEIGECVADVLEKRLGDEMRNMPTSVS